MGVIEQPRLLLRMEAYPIERSAMLGPVNFTDVMNQTLSLCKFRSDKEAADKLKIDSALLSKRKSGQADWWMADVRRVMERAQNLIPLAWLAHQYGHGLVMLETEAERRERALREENDELRLKNRVLVEAINGRAA